MSFKQSIENSPIVWMLSTLLAGFLAGFAAYQTILEVSGRVTVASEDYESGKKAIAMVSDLENQVAGLKAKEGPAPKGHRLVVTSKLDNGNPTDDISSVKLDDKFWVTSRWIGIEPRKYYEQRWELADRDGVVDTHWHPFVPKQDEIYRTWASFRLDSSVSKAGKYRIRVFLNDDRPFDSKEIEVVE